MTLQGSATNSTSRLTTYQWHKYGKEYHYNDGERHGNHSERHHLRMDERAGIGGVVRGNRPDTPCCHQNRILNSSSNDFVGRCCFCLFGEIKCSSSNLLKSNTH